MLSINILFLTVYKNPFISFQKQIEILHFGRYETEQCGLIRENFMIQSKLFCKGAFIFFFYITIQYITKQIKETKI